MILSMDCVYNPLPQEKKLVWPRSEHEKRHSNTQLTCIAKLTVCPDKSNDISGKSKTNEARISYWCPYSFSNTSISVSICRDSPWTSIQTWPLAHLKKTPCNTRDKNSCTSQSELSQYFLITLFLPHHICTHKWTKTEELFREQQQTSSSRVIGILACNGSRKGIKKEENAS